MSADPGDVNACPECGAALCSKTCWSCGGTPPSWFCICEECGGRGQLLVCPACLSPPQGAAERNYWCGSVGQFSDPFYCRQQEQAFIVPPDPKPLLLRASQPAAPHAPEAGVRKPSQSRGAVSLSALPQGGVSRPLSPSQPESRPSFFASPCLGVLSQ